MRGKPCPSRTTRAASRDHPRACGENEKKVMNEKALRGSPPRMRGKLFFIPSISSFFGITPAHAGKTHLSKISCRAPWDHPRACGENQRQSRKTSTKRGSPPRMRGKRSTFPYKKTVAGITPAHAGKTTTASDYPVRHRDHPRACGENAAAYHVGNAREGSPPRMRGKLFSPAPNEVTIGITPAHAGKTKMPR